MTKENAPLLEKAAHQQRHMLYIAARTCIYSMFPCESKSFFAFRKEKVMHKHRKRMSSGDFLMKSLNLNYLTLTNKSYGVGKYGLIHMATPDHVNLDYLALYSKPSEYGKSGGTAVCFYQYDDVFDGRNGLWNAIYYNDRKRQEEFRERFRLPRYFLSPDYSLCGDVPEVFNIYNIQRARIVSLWLTMECDKIVIPGITFAHEESFSYMLDGLEECSVVAFSTKGSLKNREQRELFREAVDYTVYSLKLLKQIVVYDVSRDFEKTKKIFFSKAVEKGIEVLFPDNLLRERNLRIGGRHHG